MLPKEEYFERVEPGAVGISPVLLREAIEALSSERLGLHSFLVLRQGKIVWEAYAHPYRADARHALFSVSKSFTSVGAGFALGEGKLSLTDRVISFFPEKIPAGVCENMGKMQIRHLLIMSPGFDAAPHDFKRHRKDDVVNDFPYSYDNFIYRDTIDWTKDFLRSYVAHAPGEKFIYASACSNMLAAIIEKVSGQTLLDYLKDRLFIPLGIEDVSWQQCPSGYTIGGWGLSLRPVDLAKFAQFLLQKGKWEGRQLLSPAYIEEATRNQIRIGNGAARWQKAFGYQIWILGDEGAYAGIGAFGQMYAVFPAQDAVFVMTGGSRIYMKAIDILMEKLLPAMEGTSLPQSGGANTKLQTLPVPEGLSSWDMPRALRYSGVEYVFSENHLAITSVEFTFGAEDFITLGINGEKTRMKIGYGTWEYGFTAVREDEQTDVHTQILFHAAALSGAWEGDAYHLEIVFYETCYISHLEIIFTDYGIRMKHRRNVGFVQSANTEIVGMRVES